MRKVLWMVLMLLCLTAVSSALAQGTSEERPLAQPITGRAGEMSYTLPQFQVQCAADEAINRYYREQEMLLQSEADFLPECETLSFRMEHHSQRYASVVFSRMMYGGNGSIELISADTFARDGVYAGQRLTLSSVLGIEDETEDSSHAAELAYRLIWENVQRDTAKADGDYPEGVAEADVRRALQPEEDFYLDQDGNIVFFVQAGELAGEIAGILTFPFSPAEMLSYAIQ